MYQCHVETLSWSYCYKIATGEAIRRCVSKDLPLGGNAMKRIVQKFVGSKGLYYLLMIAALGLALGANVKWHP